MKPLVEIGKDGQCLFWQPHLLTEALAESRPPHDDLALEPSPNPAGVSADLFNVRSDHAAISWSWGHWSRVEIRAEAGEGAGAALAYANSQPPSVGWKELPSSGAVELTFYVADGAAAGCVKVEAPDAAGFGRDVEFSGARRGEVFVTLLNSKSTAGVTVERRTVGQLKEYPLKGEPVPFGSGQTRVCVPLPYYFFGIIAVVRNAGGRRRLLGYAQYNGREVTLPDLSEGLAAEELTDLRRCVERETGGGPPRPQREATADEWLENWPSVSRKRLGRLLEQARRRAGLAERDAYKVLRAHPAGLLRYLALSYLGYKSRSPERLIRQLDGSSFQAALNAALPGLGRALLQLGAPAEKGWAVRHAENTNVAEAAASAAGQGVSALERALHLLDVRSEARALWEARRGSSGAFPP